jgi:hypothetical protein
VRQPDFDLDRAIGAQGELWVSDVIKALTQVGRSEVKTDRPFLRNQHFYVEYKCRGRDGIWRPSGISESKADLFVFKFGMLAGALVIGREWLKRAVKVAYQKPSARKRCMRGSNPTLGVVVSLADLWLARDGEP